MPSARENRLIKIEQSLGINQSRPPIFFFYASKSFTDEPGNLIISATLFDGKASWKRNENESLEDFKKRIIEDLNNFDGMLQIIYFQGERDLMEKDITRT